MNISRSLVLASLGFGLLAVGCSGASDELGSPFEELPTASELAGGNGGTNGEPTNFFHAFAPALLDIAGRPLKASAPVNTYQINPESASILDTEGGRKTFEYAARCALGGGDYVVGGDPAASYYGDSMLGTTAGWGSNALTTSQKEDLFTCLLPHVNAHGFSVGIYLTGPSIAPDSSDETHFDLAEAVWLAEVQPGNELQYRVWPQSEVAAACGSDLKESFRALVCGADQDCNLDVRTSSFASDCTGSNGNYTCLGKPAIQSKIRAVDLTKRHPECTQ